MLYIITTCVLTSYHGNMTFAVIVAQVLAIIYLAVGLRVFIQNDFYGNLVKEIEKSDTLTLLFGILAIVIWFVLLVNPSIGYQDWTLLLTIVGMIALLKGFSLILFPSEFMKMFQPMYTKANANRVGVMCVILAVVFGYFGLMPFFG